MLCVLGITHTHYLYNSHRFTHQEVALSIPRENDPVVWLTSCYDYRLATCVKISNNFERITMVNGSISRCMGVVEDVPVKLDGEIVMTDFVVVESPQVKTKEMGKDMLLLGRPFITSTCMVVDLFGRRCSVQLNGEERMLQASATPYSIIQANIRSYLAAHTGPLYTYSRSRIGAAAKGTGNSSATKPKA